MHAISNKIIHNTPQRTLFVPLYTAGCLETILFYIMVTLICPTADLMETLEDGTTFINTNIIFYSLSPNSRRNVLLAASWYNMEVPISETSVNFQQITLLHIQNRVNFRLICNMNLSVRMAFGARTT
jgi:hypothetical protein